MKQEEERELQLLEKIIKLYVCPTQPKSHRILGQSPDLTLIENMCTDIKKAVFEKRLLYIYENVLSKRRKVLYKIKAFFIVI